MNEVIVIILKIRVDKSLLIFDILIKTCFININN